MSSSTNILLVIGESAGLAPWSNDGGRTMIHALLDESRAIDAGDKTKAAGFALLDDQRERARVVDWHDDALSAVIDIGAAEQDMRESYS